MNGKGLLLCWLLLLSCIFSNGKLHAAWQEADSPPLINKSKKEKRLYKCWQKSSNPLQKKRLQKRLQKLSSKKLAPSSPPNSSLLAILCFVAGLTSLALLLITAIANGIISGPVLFGIAFGLATLLGMVAIGLGIYYYNKRFRNKEQHPQPALATIGIALGSITFFVGILLLLTFIIGLF